MRIKSARFVGLIDGLWTKVEVSVVLDALVGVVLTAVILFENDGRDIHVELPAGHDVTGGRLAALVIEGMAELDTASWLVLNPEVEKGSVAYASGS